MGDVRVKESGCVQDKQHRLGFDENQCRSLVNHRSSGWGQGPMP